jgi:hypothetical protein
MSNMVIMRPFAPNAINDGNANLSGIANLLTPDPKEVVFHSSAAGAAVIQVDLGSSQTIDSFFLGNLSYPAGSSLTVQGGAGSYTSATHYSGSLFAPSAGSSPLRQHFFTKLASPVSNRFIQFVINKSAVNATLGVVGVGLSFQPAYNREWGSGRAIVDTGAKEALLGGGFGIGEGARKAAYRWSFGDLQDFEVDRLYELALDRGETRPAVAVEDPDFTTGLNERIHYGLFDRFEAYERQNPQQTRWSLSLTEWV